MRSVHSLPTFSFSSWMFLCVALFASFMALACSDDGQTNTPMADSEVGNNGEEQSTNSGETPVEPKKVTTRSVSATNIALYWEVEASWDETVSLVVERKLSGQDTYVEVARTAATSGKFLDLALASQTGYGYRLKSCRGENCSSAVEIGETPTLPSVLPGFEITHKFQGESNDELFVFNVMNWVDAEFYAVMMAINRNGTVVWSLQDLPGGQVFETQPMSDGSFAVTTGESLAIFDQDATELYRYSEDNVHHDIDELSDGNLIYLTWYSATDSNNLPLLADKIHILNPSTNEIVWEWLAEDHIYTGDFCEFCILTTYKDYGHDWTHSNAIHFDEEQSAIYLNVRNLNRIYKIGYPSGKIEWIMGDGGDFGEGLWSHSHDPLFYEDGHFLLFDNGYHRPDGTNWSRVISVAYDETAKQASIDWEYREIPDFLTIGYGSARFTEHGVMVCDGANSRLFETSTEGEMLWEMTFESNIYTVYKANVLPRSFFENWGSSTVKK